MIVDDIIDSGPENRDEGRLAKALILASLINVRVDNPRAAEQALRAIEIAIRLGNPSVECEALMASGRVLFAIGDYNLCLADLEKALAFARERNFTVLECKCLNLMGWVFAELQRVDTSIALHETVLSKLRDGDSETLRLIANGSIASCYVELARQQRDKCNEDDANVTLRKSEFLHRTLIQEASDIGNHGVLLHLLLGQSATSVMMGQLDAATATLDQHEKLSIAIGQPHTRVRASLLRMKVFRSQIRLNAALAAGAIGIEFGTKLDAKLDTALIHELTSEIHEALNQPSDALTHLKEARNLRKRVSDELALQRTSVIGVRLKTETALVEASKQRARAVALEEQNLIFAQLAKFAKMVTADLNYDAVRKTLCGFIQKLFPDAETKIYLFDLDGGITLSQYDQCANTWVAGVIDGIANLPKVVRSCVTNYKTDGYATGSNEDSGAWLCAALTNGVQCIGVIFLLRAEGLDFNHNDISLAQSVAAYSAISFDNALAYRQVNQLLLSLRETQSELMNKNAQLEIAITKQRSASLADPLTGLGNRRYLSEKMAIYLAEDIATPSRRATDLRADNASSKPILYFFIIDIDHFKLINDSYGHGVGDDVLIQMKSRLQSVARDTDFLVRWGGEEFLVTAYLNNFANAAIFAERLRTAIADSPFNMRNGSQRTVTCSLGFAPFPFDISSPDSQTWNQVVDLADRGLYLAKNEGRNRWVGIGAGGNIDPDNFAGRICSNFSQMIESGEITIDRGPKFNQ